MVTTTLSNFRAHQSELLDAAQRAPVEILSRGSRRRAVAEFVKVNEASGCQAAA